MLVIAAMAARAVPMMGEGESRKPETRFYFKSHVDAGVNTGTGSEVVGDMLGVYHITGQVTKWRDSWFHMPQKTLQVTPPPRPLPRTGSLFSGLSKLQLVGSVIGWP